MLHHVRAIEGGTEGRTDKSPTKAHLLDSFSFGCSFSFFFLPPRLLLSSSGLSQNRFQSLYKIRTLSPGPRVPTSSWSPLEPEATSRAREKAHAARTHAPDFDSEAAVTTASAVPSVTISMVLRVLALLGVACMS